MYSLIPYSVNNLPLVEEHHIRVAGMIEESIVDGPGLRFVLFTQGCEHNCEGCHNPETHDKLAGNLVDISEIVKAYQNSGASGITISGGEPFLQGEALSLLGNEIHRLGGDVITYTGYEYRRLQEIQRIHPAVKMLLDVTDLLIDGPFIMAKRTLDRPFMGSTNQKLIALSEKGQALIQKIQILSVS